MDSIKRLLTLLLAAFMILLMAGCASTSTSESMGEYIDNSVITTKVKTELVRNLGTPGMSVKVKSYKGQVQLSGFVDNQVLADQAVQIASNVDGVHQVDNNMIVK